MGKKVAEPLGLIPNRQVMRFEFPLIRRATHFKLDGSLSGWDDRYLLPNFGALEGLDSWGRVYAAWDEEGLYVACAVDEKNRPVKCVPSQFWKGDNFRVLTDMRDTRHIKRATRFCQHFYFLPTGGGKGGKDPVAGSAKVNRAREDAPLVASAELLIGSQVWPEGWMVEAHIPAKALTGFDPGQHRRIGLFTMLEDADHGQQYPTAGDDLQWNVDPSTWPTAVLAE
jgi:hypothetical protein